MTLSFPPFLGLAEPPIPQAAIKDLAIPASLGKVEYRSAGTNSRWVIHIQDVHAHLGAQENIAAIIEHLNGVYGLKTIALEGGWSETSFPKTWALPQSREKQILVRALLEDDYITGPAYASIFSPVPINLVGIEDEALYEENRQIYVKHLQVREETEKKIKSFEQIIAGQKSSTFNPELQNFDKSLADYREGKKAEKFIPALLALADQKKVELSDLDQVEIFKKIFAIEKTIREDKLEGEAKRLEEAYKHKRLNFEEILRNRIAPEEKLAFYPEVQKYIELLKIQDQLKPKILFEQIEEAIRRVKEKLFVSAEEKALDDKSERFSIAKRILIFQATPDDLKKYEAQKETSDFEIAEGGLTEDLTLALDFYRVAKKRDRIFFDKIMTDKRLEGNMIAVTGGFHTEGLSEPLIAQGISYMVITPDLGKEQPDEKLYFERLSENPAGAQALSEVRNRFFQKDFDQGLAEIIPKTTHEIPNILDAKRAVLSYRINTGPALASSEMRGDFNSRLPAEQQAAVLDYFKMQTGKIPITIIIKRSELRELLKDPVALTLWEEKIKPQRENTVIVLSDRTRTDDPEQVLDAEMGGRAVIKRLIGTTLDQAVRQEKARQGGVRKFAIAVIDPNFQPTEGLWVFKPHAVVFLVLRPFIEYGATGISPFTDEVMAIVRDIVRTFYQEKGTLRSA
ncbi:MAG: hypothetical protein HYZ84_01250 [Candidatus Omnitrophica bacterium]|nr:hypothetical protein [Candidatus Omnitrophota bacterium]